MKTSIDCQSVLVIAAHPDDEVLGCGGVIARHAESGDQVHVLIVAEGATSRQTFRDAAAASDELSLLSNAAHKAGKILGAVSVQLLGQPDNRLDSLQLLDLIQLIEPHIQTIKPQTIYTHHSGDVNVDHRLLHQAVVTACRPTPEFFLRRLLSFEVASL